MHAQLGGAIERRKMPAVVGFWNQLLKRQATRARPKVTMKGEVILTIAPSANQKSAGEAAKIPESLASRLTARGANDLATILSRSFSTVVSDKPGPDRDSFLCVVLWSLDAFCATHACAPHGRLRQSPSGRLARTLPYDLSSASPRVTS
jgi:hypothetical protein